jgi:hypothetical protein
MTKGIHPERVSGKIKEVLNVKRDETGSALSRMWEALSVPARSAVLSN